MRQCVFFVGGEHDCLPFFPTEQRVWRTDWIHPAVADLRQGSVV